MHTLVTGGGGFLGRYICEQLVARGDRVRSFGRGAYPELAAMGIEVVRGDIRDRGAVVDACRGVDSVFHVAALAGVGGPWRIFHEVNVQGTEHVLEACQQHGVRCLVYTSSPSVTFSFVDQCGVDEMGPRDNHSEAHNAKILETFGAHYSRSKSIAELKVLAANQVDRLLTCALRPHLIWGPRDQHLIPRLIARAKSGRLRRVGDGANLVDMTYVENAAQAHLWAAAALTEEDSPVAGNAYYLSQGEPVNCWQWIDEILALASLPPVKKSTSLNTAWLVGSLLETAYKWLPLQGEPPMTRFLASQLATSHWFNISAAKRDFDYEPSISTAEGMQRLGDWLRREGQ